MALLYISALLTEIVDIILDVQYIAAANGEDQLLNTPKTVIYFMVGFVYLGIFKLILTIALVYWSVVYECDHYEDSQSLVKMVSIALTYAFEGTGKRTKNVKLKKYELKKNFSKN